MPSVIQNEITHLNGAASYTYIPGRETPFDNGDIPSKSPVKQYNNSKWERIELTSSFLQMDLVDITSFTIVMFIR